MSPPSLLFAAAALLPAMTAPSEGTPQLSTVGALIVALCNGGSMTAKVGLTSPDDVDGEVREWLRRAYEDNL